MGGNDQTLGPQIEVVHLKKMIRQKGKDIKHEHRCDEYRYLVFLQCGDTDIPPHHPNHNAVRSESNHEGNEAAEHSQKQFVCEMVLSSNFPTERHTLSVVGFSTRANRGKVKHRA